MCGDLSLSTDTLSRAIAAVSVDLMVSTADKDYLELAKLITENPGDHPTYAVYETIII